MKTKFQMEVISKIKNLRVEKGLSQVDIGRNLGISNGQMGNIESPNTTYKYTLAQLNSLCKMLGYSFQRLFCNQEKPSYSDLIEALIEYQNNEKQDKF